MTSTEMSDSTAVQPSAPASALPPDHVLSSGAVIFPGAFDQYGCPLVVFPAETQNKLVREVTEEEVTNFIRYFLRLYKSREECLVSVVADLREASVDVSRCVAETLMLLERRGQAVHTLYVVLPRQRCVAKHLHRLLLSGSRTPDPAPFKCVFLKDVFELSAYIDRSQLTASLGGYFVYCHKSWVAFVKEMGVFTQEFVTVVQQLPAYIAALQDFSNLPLPIELESLALFCSAHQTRLQQLRRDLGLDDLLRRCDLILEKLRCPEHDGCFQAMVGTHVFMQATLDTLQNHDRVTSAVDKVELLYQQAFSKARLQLQVLSLQKEAEQVLAEMRAMWRGPLRSYRREAFPLHSHAQTVQHDEFTVYMHAMALVQHAEDVIHTMVEECPVAEGRGCGAWLNELEQETDRFRSAVKLFYARSRATCHFHRCYAKVQCWYSLGVCESFLQDLLWSRCEALPRPSPADTPWRPALDAFLGLHPCPEVEELLQLVHLASALPDLHLQDAATQLAHRCLTLRQLMTSPASATLRDLQLALQWQYEHLRINHKTVATPSDLPPGRTERGVEGDGSLPGDSGFSLCSSICGNAVKVPKRDVVDAPAFAAVDGPAGGGKPPSLSSFDSGFDCAGSNHLETGSGKRVPQGLPRVPFTTCGVSGLRPPHSPVTDGHVQGVQRLSEHPSIHIVPRITADSLNLEIQVTRSAVLPANPWLSLPVDDLENAYTVTISPRRRATPQSPGQSGDSQDQPTQTDPQSRTEDQPTQTDPQSRNQDAPLQSCVSRHSLEEAGLSPIQNVLSSTMADVTAETLLWDSYDLHNLKYDLHNRLRRSMSDISLADWELKEAAALRDVEEILERTAGILQEEEVALAQEETLDVLLQTEALDRKWSVWSGHMALTQVSCNDLAEAGVLGLENDVASHLQLTSNHDEIFSEGSPGDPAGGCNVSPRLCPVSQSPGRDVLLQELRNLQALDEQILEEKQKLCALYSTEAEERPSGETSARSSEERRRFLQLLERERSEVEAMEKSLSKEMKSEGRRRKLRRSQKVIKCSIMERASSLLNIGEEEDVGDETLLLGCRRDAKHLQPGNPRAPLCGSTVTSPHQPSSPDAADVLRRLSTDLQATSSAFSLGTAPPPPDSAVCAADEGKRNSRTVEGSRCEASDWVEEGSRCEASDPRVGLMETVQERAFDPGGTGLLPRLPRSRRLLLCDQANSEEELQEDTLHDPEGPEGETHHDSEGPEFPTAPSVVPKAKECKTPPCSELQSLPAVLGHNNNNNNNSSSSPLCMDLSHSVVSKDLQLTAGSDVAGEWREASEIEREDLISGMECQPCNGLISEVESKPHQGLISEVESVLCDASEFVEEREAPVSYDVSTRSSQPEPQIWDREIGEFLTPVVLDTGSGLIKAGFADQDFPTTVFPTAIGRPKYEVMSGAAQRDMYVGHDTQHMRGVLTLHYPMRNGIVSNWDHMELLWEHAFQLLRVDPDDHPVLLTEGAVIPTEQRQRMVQLMFESFNVPLTYVARQPVLALHSAGRTTGVVFDSGDGVSHSVPVFDGYFLPHAVQRLPMAGADVTLHLQQLLQEQGAFMRTSAELEIVREIKERCCCVALDYEAELSKVGGTGMHYTLPDGRVVSLTTERFRASEILFKPELIGRDHYGMHECVFRSILQSDIDLRKSFLGNIVLSGGNTLLPGLGERLQLEVRCLPPVHSSSAVRVVSPAQRDVSVWRGGAVLASLPAFSSTWISRGEYEEFGPQIVWRKCF